MRRETGIRVHEIQTASGIRRLLFAVGMAIIGVLFFHSLIIRLVERLTDLLLGTILANLLKILG